MVYRLVSKTSGLTAVRVRLSPRPQIFMEKSKSQNKKEARPLKILGEEAQKATRKTFITLILGGFGLVAALAWNDAIQGLLNELLPKQSGLIGKFFYAIVITLIVVILSSQLGKPSGKEK